MRALERRLMAVVLSLGATLSLTSLTVSTQTNLTDQTSIGGNGNGLRHSDRTW